MMKRLLFAVLLLIVILGGARYGLHGSLGSTKDPVLAATATALPVATATVQVQSTYEVRRHYTGTVQARRSSVIGFEHFGRVIAVLVEDGDQVVSGQALASLDTRRLQAERKELAARRAQAAALLDELVAGPRPEAIEQARSRVRDLEEQLELSRMRHARAERLVAQQVAPEEDLEEAASTQEQRAARLASAREELEELLSGTREERVRAQGGVVEQLDAALELADLNLENATARAPYDGIVSARLADEGKVVAIGEPILRLIESKRPQARIGLPSDMTASVSIGQSYDLEVAGRSVRATALSFLPEMDAATRTVTAIFEFDTLAEGLYPGQVVRLPLDKTLAERGIWIPTTALTRGVHGLWNCYAVVAEATSSAHRVEYRHVEILHAQGDRLYVRGTLQDGEQVVTEGTHRLVAGQRVTPRAIES